MSDFVADESFGDGAKKMKEHYRIEVPTSAVRKVTLEHGEAMLLEEPKSELGKQGATLVIAGIDGSMIPMVSIETDKKAGKSRVISASTGSLAGRNRACALLAIRGLSRDITERRWVM